LNSTAAEDLSPANQPEAAASRAKLRSRWHSPLVLLSGVAASQMVLYLVVALLSPRFDYHAEVEQRPILAVLALLIGCVVLYLVSIGLAVRCRSGRKLAGVIVGSALVFRVVLILSLPIQEIDIYRYIWDGAVVAQGVSPFRHSPQQAVQARASDASPGLAKLARVRDASPSLAEALHRVHFADLPTVYPPLSQLVFGAVHLVTPSSATIYGRLVAMKTSLVLFDLATIFFVWKLLSLAGRHAGWIVAYAWCPLVLKEFANSGHLDAIAVCLTTAAVWATAKATFDRGVRSRGNWVLAGACLLALGVGAKLYPVALMPVMSAVIAGRLSKRLVFAFTGCFTLMAALVLTPMIFAPAATLESSKSRPSIAEVETPPSPKVSPTGGPQPSQVDSLAGLRAFLTSWEMNDFLFLVLFENLRPHDPQHPWPDAWFAITPNGWRESAVEPIQELFEIDGHRSAFLITRASTLALFAAIALWLGWRSYRCGNADVFLEAAFLTLAWFWLLAPTQNPWYWTWAMPLVVFARGRAWLALSGLVLVYYVRFWLEYHYAGVSFAGTPYQGAEFFDLVVTWIEYGPWLTLLCVEWLVRTRQNSRRNALGNYYP